MYLRIENVAVHECSPTESISRSCRDIAIFKGDFLCIYDLSLVIVKIFCFVTSDSFRDKYTMNKPGVLIKHHCEVVIPLVVAEEKNRRDRVS